MDELNELTSHLLSQMEQTLQTPLIAGIESEDLKEEVDPAAEKKQMLIKFKFERIWYIGGLRNGLEAFKENRD